MCMKVVQTQVNETEYGLLAAYAKARKTTIKDAVREAIRKLTLADSVDPSDPVFTMFPLTRKKARHSDAAERHDAYLYGGDR